MARIGDKDIIKSDLDVIRLLHATVTQKVFLEHMLSEETINELLNPMRSLDWKEKAEYADKMISILNSAKSEEETITLVRKLSFEFKPSD